MNKQSIFITLIATALLFGLSACATNSVDELSTEKIVHHAESIDTKIMLSESGACKGYGPQTPRDIANNAGDNSVVFPIATAAQDMNLCNIHFHNGAEHKAPNFSIKKLVDEAHKDYGGYQCGISTSLSSSELAPFDGNTCGGVKPGDTIEVHWVHSSCNVEPGPGLGSCLSDSCANPSLRVETKVFTVVNDRNAINFADYADVVKSNGKYQAKNLPTSGGNNVEFLGSTTGPKYTEQACSPLQVTWNVNSDCAKVDIASLSNFCGDNVFKEDHAHGVRQLVVNPELLSPIN